MIFWIQGCKSAGRNSSVLVSVQKLSFRHFSCKLILVSDASELNLILISVIVHLCHLIAQLIVAISSSISSVTGGGKTPLRGN